jgi:lipopolysaccharide/colanic/teichoic acid biosynthesis glycosyltransferase
MPEQLNDLDENGIKRLEVLPGLTGLAQVNGNIYLEWSERWKYDRYYAENISFILDLKIIFKTIRIIFQGERKFVNKLIER